MENKSLMKGEVPLGFGMALAQNTTALVKFAGLSEQQQQQMIDHTHTIHSKEEMQQYVDELAQNHLQL